METQPTTNGANDQLTFKACQKPPLTAGDYTIRVEQTIQAGAVEDRFAATHNFSMLGPRFILDPQEIETVFSPAGSLGDHDNVLPHIIFKRSTLPWERTPDHQDQADPPAPWLALLLFDAETEVQTEDDKTAPQTNQVTSKVKTLAELRQESDSGKFPKFVKAGQSPPTDSPYLATEFGEHKDDNISVIEVPKSLLQAIVPRKAELAWLSHVRQAPTNGQSAGKERAVLFCNRLPKPGGVSVVHLVALEGRYSQTDGEFMLPASDDTVSLVSLKSWRFACLSAQHSFKGLLLHLNQPLLFSMPATGEITAALQKAQIPPALQEAFLQCNHALTNPIVADTSQVMIKDRAASYLIGAKGQVYNQAGKELGFALNPLPAPGSAPESMRQSFMDQVHLRSPQATVAANNDAWWIHDSGQVYFVRQEGEYLYVYHQDPDRQTTLRLPKHADATVEQYFARGCVPLPHAMRQGNKTVSWYHGPLTPEENATVFDMSLPAATADELVYYNPEHGMFDLSYAAAWELGRLLTLQNQGVALALFHWKRAHAQFLKDAETQLTHLILEGPAAPPDLPATVVGWFKNLALLHDVPFAYLVPAEAMLPPESLRFFQVDRQWIASLLDGAFSVGRVQAADHAQDTANRPAVVTPAHGAVSGFLLRSDVVAGWPGLLVNGDAEVLEAGVVAAQPLPLLRMERLSPNILLCLFDGCVQTVDLHQTPESLHFGVDRPDGEAGCYSKQLRSLDGGTVAELPTDIPWRDKTNRVLDIAGFAEKLKNGQVENFTSAQFAVQMIEGVEKVRFQGKKMSTHTILQCQ